jgi:hypothetical protein
MDSKIVVSVGVVCPKELRYVCEWIVGKREIGIRTDCFCLARYSEEQLNRTVLRPEIHVPSSIYGTRSLARTLLESRPTAAGTFFCRPPTSRYRP